MKQYVNKYLLLDIENVYSQKIIKLMMAVVKKYDKAFEEKMNYYVQKAFNLD
ncbi:hypothetical protein [Lactobacillus taiwanensis]|uniref:hypothetical protein n=1 Tax=Lactobacillus taiwanensis TaxID=508451 RepID=UPI001AEBC079|nr:hypothetical protein [Lactobacillus taiwanensis]QTQ40821.1 hypothetical protein H1A07_09735 [Lactobacillus taiwanensis]